MICAPKIFQNVLRNGFYRPSCADRHEGRRFHWAMCGVDTGLTGRAGLSLDGERESHNRLWYRALSEIPSAAEESVYFERN